MNFAPYRQIPPSRWWALGLLSLALHLSVVLFAPWWRGPKTMPQNPDSAITIQLMTLAPPNPSPAPPDSVPPVTKPPSPVAPTPPSIPSPAPAIPKAAPAKNSPTIAAPSPTPTPTTPPTPPPAAIPPVPDLPRKPTPTAIAPPPAPEPPIPLPTPPEIKTAVAPPIPEPLPPTAIAPTVTPSPAPSNPTAPPPQVSGLRTSITETTLAIGDRDIPSQTAQAINPQRSLGAIEELKSLNLDFSDTIILETVVVIHPDGRPQVYPEFTQVHRGPLTPAQGGIVAKKIIESWRFEPTYMGDSPVMQDYNVTLEIQPIFN